MARRRTKPLPKGIYERRFKSGIQYWYAFRDQTGARKQAFGGTTIEEAVRAKREREAEVEAGTYVASLTRETTLARYAPIYVSARRDKGVRSVEREDQILRDHILPHLGDKRLGELRPTDVAAWVDVLDRKLAPKSVLNAHGVLSTLLARARFEGLVLDNVAQGLPAGILPQNVRKRNVGAFTREECAAMISCEAIPEDRRIAYALAAFTGARCGEVAGLRWRDLDTKAAPLWRWSLRTQYEGRPLKGKGRQGGPPRDVPIHPELQALLERWRADGWARFMCRHPRPDDFVCPREDGTVHSKQSLGAKAVHRHAKLAGVDSTGRDFHSFRRAMITIARTDGAREDLLERVTHNAKGAMIDGYTYFGWEALCSAVQCIRLAPETIAPALPLTGQPVTKAVTDGEKADEIGLILMEAPGVEPGSESALRWLLRA